MKHPVGRRLVEPWTRLEESTEDRYPARATHALGLFPRLGQAEHLTALRPELLDQLRADAAGGSCDEGGRPCGCHAASVRCGVRVRPPTTPALHPYDTRTDAA